MPAESQVRHCPACGVEVPPEARLCHSCGAELRRPATTQATAPSGGAEVPSGAAVALAEAAEQAAGVGLPVGIAPRGPWQDGTAIGLDSDAEAAVREAAASGEDEPLDESKLPPEVLLLLRAPAPKPGPFGALGGFGAELTWGRVIGCLFAMLLLGALTIAMLWMLRMAREATNKVAAQRALNEQLLNSDDYGEISPPEEAVDPDAPNEPAPVQPRQGAEDAAGEAESGGATEGEGGEWQGGDSLF